MYETGVGLAFLLWCVAQVRLLVAVNSQLERNLRKVGMRHSWLTLTARASSKDDWPVSFGGKALKFALLAAVGLMGVLFSWLSVIAFVCQFLYARAKDSGAPEEVRELRWRLRNQEMTKEQIAEAFARAALGTEADKAQIKDEFMRTESL